MNNKAFEKVLEEQLGSIEQPEDSIARISQIGEQISQLESQIAELRQQMQHELEGLVGTLAVSVRKELPGVSVSLNGGKCHVNHLSHKLSLGPDIKAGTWNVEPNRAGRRFGRHHGTALALQTDVGPLASNIGSFFRKRYKRLANESRPVKPISDKAGGAIGWK
jgi:hypothetical protein